MTAVRMLWGQRVVTYDGEYAPELLLAWDEYTLDDNWDGWVEARDASIAELGSELAAHREIIVEVDDDAIDALFAVPTVTARMSAGNE
jgi:hypothetical protein